MIYLLTTATGEERLIGSQQESLSGGALQFYLRISGDLRLQVAYAPGTWKSVSRIPKEQAQQLISDGMEHDKACLLHIDGKLEKTSTSATGSASASATSGQATHTQATGDLKNRTLGQDPQGRTLSLMVTQYGPRIKAQPKGDADALWVPVPAELDPATLSLTQAIALVAAFKPRKKRSN